MTYLTSLSKTSQDTILSMSGNPRTKNLGTSLAIAKAIARRLNVPSGEVESLHMQYMVSSSEQVVRILSALNELTAVDVETIKTYAEKFYNVRYYALNPPANILMLNADTAIQDFFSISTAVDQTALAELKNESVFIAKTYNEVSSVIDEMLTGRM